MSHSVSEEGESVRFHADSLSAAGMSVNEIVFSATCLPEGSVRDAVRVHFSGAVGVEEWSLLLTRPLTLTVGVPAEAGW